MHYAPSLPITQTDAATVCAEAFEFIADCTSFDPVTGRASNARSSRVIGYFPPTITDSAVSYTLPISNRPGATVALTFPTV